MWTAAILAGGQARRLGGLDKSALAVGDAVTIRERQLAALRDLTPHILIVTRAAVQEQNAVHQQRASGLRVVHDRVPDSGALGGLYTALMEAPTEQVVVLACDMPFVTASFLSHLAGLGNDPRYDAVVPRDDAGRHPLCASYRRQAAAAMRARIDAGRLRVLDALGDLVVRDIGPDELHDFDADGRLLLNVNTPEDFARAQDLERTAKRYH
jgi:molybdopterin-guanine dinucleotide biosynthesis protein A